MSLINCVVTFVYLAFSSLLHKAVFDIGEDMLDTHCVTKKGMDNSSAADHLD